MQQLCTTHTHPPKHLLQTYQYPNSQNLLARSYIDGFTAYCINAYHNTAATLFVFDPVYINNRSYYEVIACVLHSENDANNSRSNRNAKTETEAETQNNTLKLSFIEKIMLSPNALHLCVQKIINQYFEYCKPPPSAVVSTLSTQPEDKKGGGAKKKQKLNSGSATPVVPVATTDDSSTASAGTSTGMGTTLYNCTDIRFLEPNQECLWRSMLNVLELLAAAAEIHPTGMYVYLWSVHGVRLLCR